jgi:hypothetical protein
MIIQIKSKRKEKYYVIANNDISDSKCRGRSQIENIHIISIIRCWGPSASEGPQKHDLTMFLEYNV